MDIAKRAARIARAWIGTPYRHQASTLGAGCDCLGLVRAVWRELYDAPEPAMPAYSPSWAEISGEETLLEAAARHLVARDAPPTRAVATGDVIVFRMRAGHPAKHCAVADGPDRFIHAYEGVGVVSSALTEPWRRRIAGLFSFPEVTR